MITDRIFDAWVVVFAAIVCAVLVTSCGEVGTESARCLPYCEDNLTLMYCDRWDSPPVEYKCHAYCQEVGWEFGVCTSDDGEGYPGCLCWDRPE